MECRRTWQTQLEGNFLYFGHLGRMAQGLDGTAGPRGNAACNHQDVDHVAQVGDSSHQLFVEVENLFLEVT